MWEYRSVETVFTNRTIPVSAVCAVLLFAALSAIADVTRNLDYIPGTEYSDSRDHLDIHMPLGAKDTPVLVYFHGGALMFGDKHFGDPVAQRLVPLGLAVVSANYRLSPGVKHPSHAQDAAAAVAWTMQHISEYGGDPSRIYVAGHSAGAYLAALLAVDATYLARYEIGSDAIAGAVLISPFLYVEETAKDRPKDVWGPEPDDWLAASVTPHIAAGKPPMLLLYADGDEAWRKDQNIRFTEAMRQSGNADTSAIELPNRDHSSLISEINDSDDQIGEQILEFIGKTTSID